MRGIISGGFGESTVIDNGISCDLLLPKRRVDINGCISTGGPKICIRPGTLQNSGNSLSTLSKEELKNLIGPEQTIILRNLFGSGMKGAEEALKNNLRPIGLKDSAIDAYRELAIRAIESYKKTGNSAGEAVQKARIEILNKLSK